VTVGKETTARTETVRETARRQDVNVENLKGEDKEVYTAASQYVDTLTRNRRYEGKDWSAIESDVRKDWEKTRPGTWDRYKTAIQSGWEKIAYSGPSRRR